MMVSTKQNYEDQDEGRIMQAARKQQYIMFRAPILRSQRPPRMPWLTCKTTKTINTDLLNYSHNPRCAPARTNGQIQAPREPPN
jgi:hypothetical protein